jgi:SAM-dependent methyltransferase
MGLTKTEVIDILKIREQNDFHSLLMLGKQNIGRTDTLDVYRRILDSYGFKYDHDKYQKLYPDVDAGLSINIDSVRFFECFFDEVHALDINAYEGADIIFDLQSDELPDELSGKWDLVVDGGTLEHIFDQQKAFTNMNRLVKVGGYIYHSLPCAGWVNHGFYSFSPTYFTDQYTRPDGFVLENIYFLHRIGADDISKSMDCRLFSDAISMNRYIAKAFAEENQSYINLAVIARKTGLSGKASELPTQTMYEEIYQNTESLNDEEIVHYARQDKIYLYAASTRCYEIIEMLKSSNLDSQIIGVIDSDTHKQGKYLAGCRIVPLDDNVIRSDAKIIVASSYYKESIIRRLNIAGISSARIV